MSRHTQTQGECDYRGETGESYYLKEILSVRCLPFIRCLQCAKFDFDHLEHRHHDPMRQKYTLLPGLFRRCTVGQFRIPIAAAALRR